MEQSVLIDAIKKLESEECDGDFYLTLAKRFSSKGNYYRALDFYTRAAEKGVVEAQYYMGNYHYRNNKYSKASEWYKKAYSQGHVESGYMLGMCCYKNSNYSEASGWYKKAYSQGHVESGYMLGTCSFKQWAFITAIKYWREAAARGSSDAKKAVFWVNLFYLFIFAAILLGVFIFYNINAHNMSRTDSVQSASVSSQFSSNGAKDKSVGAKQVETETAKLEIWCEANDYEILPLESKVVLLKDESVIDSKSIILDDLDAKKSVLYRWGLRRYIRPTDYHGDCYELIASFEVPIGQVIVEINTHSTRDDIPNYLISPNSTFVNIENRVNKLKVKCVPNKGVVKVQRNFCGEGEIISGSSVCQNDTEVTFFRRFEDEKGVIWDVFFVRHDIPYTVTTKRYVCGSEYKKIYKEHCIFSTSVHDSGYYNSDEIYLERSCDGYVPI